MQTHYLYNIAPPTQSKNSLLKEYEQTHSIIDLAVNATV